MSIRRRVYDFIHHRDSSRDLFISLEAARLPKGSKVLDVGAGPCRHRPFFAHCEYKAQDFGKHEGSTEGPLADKGTWAYGQLDYICDATDIPVESCSFDAVLCTEVLEHVPMPEKVIGEIARILKKGGILILTAPLGSGLHLEPHHYYGGFTPWYYRRVLESAGFEQIVVSPNGGFFSHHAQETQRFSAWIDPRRLPLFAAILLFPIWLISLPWCRLIYPLLSRWLDKYDEHKGFTVGYHVTATKRMLKTLPSGPS